ncbi:uncharacterized protein LOC135804674 [Sycon ciliatum]|uniref:uncharacterized protein LOC135804674 n=1 Tax=Sycon ciliatum TaxID=27933 RepID=UPI0031F617AE
MWSRKGGVSFVTLMILVVNAIGMSRCQSCSPSAFPDTSNVRTFLDGTASGSKDHLRYVASLFQQMSSAQANCSADASRTRSTFTTIPNRVFADGFQSRVFEQQEVFSVSNAQLLNNLLLSAPPTANNASSAKQSYCFAESGDQCTDCNIWQNDLYFNSHLRATLEARPDATAVGTCFKTGPTTMDCREATAVASKNISISRQSSVNTGSCSESWKWQKPLDIFNAQQANGSFSKSSMTNIVSDVYQRNQTVYYVTRNTSAWSDVISQCYEDGRTEWVHIHTVPVIVNCTTRLASAKLCTTAEVGKLVIVGSSWTAFSLRTAYNLTQCPASSSGPQNDVFVGSAACGQANVAGDLTELLQCVNRPSGFQPNSYACSCPGAMHLVDSQESNTVVLSGQRVSYLGSYIASRVGSGVKQISVSTCQACQPGCRSCIDAQVCLRSDDPALRIPIVSVSAVFLAAVVVLALYIYKVRLTNVIQSALPPYLFGILVGGVFTNLEAFITFHPPHDVLCALQPWLRHVAFVLTFGFLFGKIWRVHVLARIAPGRIRVGALDASIQRFVLAILGLTVLYLTIWTATGRATVEIMYDGQDRSYARCSVDYWRYIIHGAEFLFLLMGCVVAHLTRRLVLDWSEFKFLLAAFANAAVAKGLIGVFYFTLLPNKYADYLYLLQFFDNLLTVDALLIIVFAPKVYMIQRQKGDREIGPTISMKLPPKESKPDAGESEQVHTEVALHEHVDVRPEAGAGAVERNESSPGRGAGSPVPVADIGILDVMCGCFCGVLKAEWSVDDGATAGTETGRPLDVLATQFTVANASPATTEGNTTSAASASPAMTDQHDGGKKTGEDEEKQSGATAT